MRSHTSRTQNIGRIVLGGLLILAGISHLTFKRKDFKAQVPNTLPHNLPISQDNIVVISGVAEILLGLSLVFFGNYKARVGEIAALFFTLIFPGNISQFIHKEDAFGLDSDSKRFARLFFQPVLITWALWATGAEKPVKLSNFQSLIDKI